MKALNKIVCKTTINHGAKIPGQLLKFRFGDLLVTTNKLINNNLSFAVMIQDTILYQLGSAPHQLMNSSSDLPIDVLHILVYISKFCH